MNKSKNYNLWLPEDTDPVKVSDLSENFEVIDAALADMIDNLPSTISGEGTVPAFSIVARTAGTHTATKEIQIPIGKPVRSITLNLSVVSKSNSTTDTLPYGGSYNTGNLLVTGPSPTTANFTLYGGSTTSSVSVTGSLQINAPNGAKTVTASLSMSISFKNDNASNITLTTSGSFSYIANTGA